MTLDRAIEEYGDLVLHIAWRITHDRSDAQDVCQEAFLKLQEALTHGHRSQSLTLNFRSSG